jgi:hypothetical protein
LFQKHIHLVQANAVVAKLLDVVLRQFIPAAPSAGYVGQGVQDRCDGLVVEEDGGAVLVVGDFGAEAGGGRGAGEAG